MRGRRELGHGPPASPIAGMADRVAASGALGLAAALAALAIYAGMFAVGRAGAAGGLDAFDQTAIRFGASALIVLPFALRAARAAARRMGARALLAVLVLGGAPYSCVFLGGLVFAPVAYGAAIVPALQPVVVMALGAWLFGHRPAPRAMLAALLCLAGLGVMVAGVDASGGTALPVGIGLFLLSATLWGGYAVALRAWKVAPGDLLAVSVPLSAVLYLPSYLAWRGTDALLAAPAEAVLLQAVYQGVLVGVVALLLYAWAVGRIGAQPVAALAPAMPVAAALIGQVFLGEAPGTFGWFGLAVVTVGLAIGARLPAPRAIPARSEQHASHPADTTR